MCFIFIENCRMFFDDYVFYGMMLRDFEDKGVKVKAFGYREDIE